MAEIAVLLVEDETLILTALKTELSDAGFQIFVAMDGSSALAELHTDINRFRAVVTDIKLGAGPDGWAVAKRARELDPEIPVVYMSGDSSNDWPSKGVPNSVMIVKPFAPAQLITAVSTLINEAGIRRGG
jgi:DNA-binding response OmpR family regulator